MKDLLSERTGKLSVGKMRAFLKVDEGVNLSDYKTRQIKEYIEATHPEIFEKKYDSIQSLN